MDWPAAAVLIALIVCAAGVRMFRDWLGCDNTTTEAIGFMHFTDREDD